MNLSNITGSIIYDYYFCKRRCSLVVNDMIFRDKNNINLLMGKIIEESTYKRRSDKFKNFDIGGGKVDYIDFKKNIIFETKKTSKFIESAKFQLLWYLYLLNVMKPNGRFTGIIEIPTERKRVKVVLSNEQIKLIEDALDWIETVYVDKKIIKDKLKVSVCKKCSFFNYCYI